MEPSDVHALSMIIAPSLERIEKALIKGNATDLTIAFINSRKGGRLLTEEEIIVTWRRFRDALAE